MSKNLYILDPPHGIDVPGKRSPDGKHREYKWGREVCSLIIQASKVMQLDVVQPIQDEEEIGLSNRVRLYNALPSLKPKIVVSFHNNAAGMGASWMNARGFSAYTSKGKTNSDKYAEIIINEFIKDFPQLKTRIETIDGDKDYEANFTILMGNRYSAVLLEILFQDNKEDVAILNSIEFKVKFVQSILDAFKKIELL
jgi:N-acetylmuramoyl-L-alanine amidase